MSNYEIVIGIETHVQLATKTKLFCGCDNDSRTVGPNAHVCPVCLGFPGALPVLNKRAVELSLQAGLALSGTIPERAKFDRKNYFYPDSPMNYQITQFDQPIVGMGFVDFPLDGVTKRVGITRAHLEADAGKLVHPAGADYSLVDLNRAGTPLLEIVSEPDMRSAAEAKAYAQELYHLMRYAGVSDCDLYYGNMRFDVNVSLRPIGATEFGTRTESKNLNSFRAIAGVVEYEARRQAELLDRGEVVIQETRGWDENKNVTISQRTKEEAHDYRYFPEPDLPPVVVTEAMRAVAISAMPAMLPNNLRAQLADHGLPVAEAEVLLESMTATRYLTEIITSHPDHARFAFNWLIGDRIRLEDEKKQTLDQSDITAVTVAGVAELVSTGQLSSTNAKALLEKLWEDDIGPVEAAKKFKLIQLSDISTIEAIVEQVIADNPGPVEQYRAGETKVAGFLVGQVMKLSKGQANPPMVNDILKKKLT